MATRRTYFINLLLRNVMKRWLSARRTPMDVHPGRSRLKAFRFHAVTFLDDLDEPLRAYALGDHHLYFYFESSLANGDH
jgi:hypothetical protein